MTYDVFISYSRKDTAVADRICGAFDRAGISYFIDRQGIAGGMEFPAVLAEAIENSRLFLFLASENSYQSKFTNNEVLYAFNEKPHNSLLPYVIDGSKMPAVLRFTFASINVRNIDEHPIEPVLVDDVLRLLGSGRSEQPKPAPKPQTPVSGNKVFNVGGVELTMVYVEGGTFTIGATSEQEGDAWSYEKPTHKVTLNSFYIGQTTVTQALWKAVMGNSPSYFNPCSFKGDNLPVEGVTWDNAHKFIKKLNRMTGQTFRLPTEAEWEYAARGGRKSKGYKYSGGNDIDSVAWYMGNSDKKTHPVAQKQPNELGLYDMSGNISEYCQDWHGDYSNNAQSNPKGPSSGSFRVERGGSWYDDSRYCRVSHRSWCRPSERYSNAGFRLALT